MTKLDKPIREIFDDFINQREFQDLEVYYKQPNLLKIVGKHRSETAHSAFWGWLLNPKGSHNLGIAPLEMFIKSTIPEFSNNHNLSDVSVITESSIKGGRFDIFIDSNQTNTGLPFSIIIENKINASENFEQTLKYHKWSGEKNKKKENYFIYMKPYELDISGIPLSVDEKGDIFKKISYQKLYEDVLYPLFYLSSETYLKYATEYIASLSTTESDYGHLIITKAEKKLYEVIICNYKDSLNQIICSFGKDKSIENHKRLNHFYNLLHYIRYYNHVDFKERMSIINEILDGTRDFTKFQVCDLSGNIITKPALPKNQLFPFILNRINIRNLIFDEFQELIPANLNLVSDSNFAYLSFNTIEDADSANSFYGKERKNPFFDFENKILLKDKIIVIKKAWTATRKSEFNGKSSIELLVDFVNSRNEVFQMIIKPIE